MTKDKVMATATTMDKAMAATAVTATITVTVRSQYCGYGYNYSYSCRYSNFVGTAVANDTYRAVTFIRAQGFQYTTLIPAVYITKKASYLPR